LTCYLKMPLFGFLEPFFDYRVTSVCTLESGSLSYHCDKGSNAIHGIYLSLTPCNFETCHPFSPKFCIIGCEDHILECARNHLSRSNGDAPNHVSNIKLAWLFIVFWFLRLSPIFSRCCSHAYWKFLYSGSSNTIFTKDMPFGASSFDLNLVM
jgi:hypothetical protein